MNFTEKNTHFSSDKPRDESMCLVLTMKYDNILKKKI